MIDEPDTREGAYMKIAKNTVVSVNYKLSDAQGVLIEESREPMVYLHGGYENTLPKIEEALDGKETGYNTTIKVEPADAFGEYDADLVKTEPKNRLPSPIEVGMQFEGSPDDEQQSAVIFTVTEIAEDTVVLDGNHPLAGIALVFELSVAEVRAATEEEIEHQHVHGPHGHHHHGHDHGDDEGGDGEEGDHFRSHPIH
ncbi:FKBP-type peptidyl-prolyl cis-trans isomerase SlyD [Herbaspirillum sp. Sphag64]|nr:FKBP-type peptidyl-prolyl cis-trans isomerase SlyD [Herbaspirillum sp. Sphag64]